MDAILDDNKLNDLRTKKIYNKLDNGTEGCQGDTFYNLAKQILNEYSVRQVGSDKILKGLCYVYRKNFRDESDNDICDFLYYWLGDILYDNLINMVHFDIIIYKLFLNLKIHNGIKCTVPTYYKFSEWKYFKDIKLFFDYSKEYDTYEKQISSNNMLCNEKYKKYLQTYVDTYNKFQGECQDKPTSSGYCKAFNEYFAKKNITKLSTWACNLPNSELEAEKAPGKAEKTKEPPIQAHGMGEESVTLPGRLERGKEKGAESSSSPVYSSREGKSELDSVSVPEHISSISRTTKTIATTASVAGILVPPFLVYNFTPVRSWINKLLGRKPIYRNPLTERELLENSYQPDHLDSERNRYNILYRPE